MRRLTFYSKYLDPVRDGRKTTTIRKTRVVRNLKSGERILLAFGSWRQPTVLKAVCTDVTPLNPDALNPTQRRRIARDDGITRHDLDCLLAEPTPKTLVRFELVNKRPLLELVERR